MSAGSDASNLGYGNTAPFSNVNGQFVNVGSTNNPANFSSNEIPGLPGLAGAKNNVVAAQGVVPGICMKGGGAKKKRWSLAALRRKIKNITRQYKRMRAGARSRSRKQMVARAMQLMRARRRSVAGGRSRSRRHRHSRRCRHTRRQRGGYAQYQNNLPMTNTYSTGGYLSANNSALANPVPYTRLSNCTNCVDNYNHYTNQGFPSKGH